jgi:hypothetical protein
MMNDIVRAMFFVGWLKMFECGIFLDVCDQRSNAAGEAKNSWPAFAFDLLGAEAE